MFQLIARHLLHTLNIIVVESFTTPHHYCPMSVQPLPALTVTELSGFRSLGILSSKTVSRQACSIISKNLLSANYITMKLLIQQFSSNVVLEALRVVNPGLRFLASSHQIVRFGGGY